MCSYNGRSPQKLTGVCLPESLRKMFCHVKTVKEKVLHASKTWEKESINCLECCEKRFMEEWKIKLYIKNNCGLSPLSVHMSILTAL